MLTRCVCSADGRTVGADDATERHTVREWMNGGRRTARAPDVVGDESSRYFRTVRHFPALSLARPVDSVDT